MPLKNARIHLRVTDEEKQSLVEKATLARQSVSQYILSLSENKTIIVVDGADEVTRQLGLSAWRIRKYSGAFNFPAISNQACQKLRVKTVITMIWQSL
jgi:uncharacterized protein (DUF1778 family)